MSNLKLVTTERFGDMDCNFYRNTNDDILLTREQIGNALEYANPKVALSIVHKKHKDRLDSLSVVTKLIATDGKQYDTILYTEKGIMEICRWSRQPKANEFMDWVWTIVENYRSGNLNSSVNLQPLVDTLTTAITSMQQDISELKESTKKKSLPEKKYSRWKTNTFKKLNTLHEYVNEHSDENLSLPNIIHLVIGETEDTYGIEINDYLELHKSEYDLDTNPYAIDVINHYKDIKDMFTLTLDSIMEKLHIGDKKESTKNIFDELAEMVNE